MAMTTSRRKKHRRKAAPASQGFHEFLGQQKNVVITVVVLVALAILILASLLRLGPFVGKAITFGAPEEGQAGVFVAEGTEEPDVPFIVPIRAHLGTDRSISVRFTMEYDPLMLSVFDNCAELVLEELDRHFIIPREGGDLDLSVIRSSSCDGGEISVEYVGLCSAPEGDNDCPNALTGMEEIASVNFIPLQEATTTLSFSSFELRNLDNRLIPLATEDASVIIAEPVVEEEIVEEEPPVPEEPVDEEVPSAEAPAAAPSGGGGGGGGSGGGRVLNWECENWSSCDATKSQTRTCTASSGRTQTETKECLRCQESWVCTAWEQRGGRETRSCVDETACGTTAMRPVLTRETAQPVAGPAPTRVVGQLPDVKVPAGIVAPAAKVSFWKSPKTYLISIPVIIIAAVAVLLGLYYSKRKGEGSPEESAEEAVQKE